ncbi:hypothetical protein [Pseudalkalibacillus sp. JSM 102089]|uniref:hypothetical protein n=1 Tax=Pseudalkalibacillus sp. JSM 102089 TaxID=3229856 RepID=UPI003523CDA1
MDNQNRGNVYTLVLAILGLTKLISEVFFNFSLFSDSDIDQIANYVAVIVAVGGLYLNNSLKSTTFKKEDK